MRLALPLLSSSLESTLSPSFGRALSFLLYDTPSGPWKFVSLDSSSLEGGAGVKTAQGLVDEEVDGVLTLRCGQNSSRVLQAAGIKIYEAKDVSARLNIDLFLAGKLERLCASEPGFMKGR